MRRISTFLSRVAAFLTTSRGPLPYSKEWIIEDLATRLRASEARVEALQAELVASVRAAADAVVAQHGAAPIFSQPAPTEETPPAVVSVADKREEMRKIREGNRHRFAELIGKTYAEVLHREQAGMFNAPKWNIHDPHWWSTIGAALERERSGEGTADVVARA